MFVVQQNGLLHETKLDRVVEATQFTCDRLRQRRFRRLRKPFHPLASRHHRRPWKAHEHRLREMRMAHHELTLVERRHARLDRRAQYLIAGRCQLVAVHATVQRRARVTCHAAMHLRAKLLRAEEHQPEVPTAFGDIEQHFADISIGSIVRGILVQLIDEDDDVIHAELPPLELFTQPGHHPGEDEVLCVFLHVGDIDHVHRAIHKAPERQIRHGAVIGHESSAARGQIGQAVPDLAHGGGVVRAPGVAVGIFQLAQHLPEPRIEIGERLNAMYARKAGLLEILADHALPDEVDERVGLRVDVVFIQQHFGELQHLAQPPRERRHTVGERRVRAQRVQREAASRERREVAHVLKRCRRHTEHFVYLEIGRLELSRLIEEAEVRTLHIETDRRDGTAMRGKVREDGLQQPLDSAGFRSESRDTGNVQVRCFRPHQKVGVEEDRRTHAAGPIHADGDSRGRFAGDIPVHTQRHSDIGIVGEVHRAEWHGLQRFFGDMSQHRRGVQPYFSAIGVRQRPVLRTAIVSEHVVQR